VTLLAACHSPEKGATEFTEEFGQIQEAIFNGSPTLGDEATVYLVMTVERNGSRIPVSTCTGTLVKESRTTDTASKVVASARHCPKVGRGIAQLGLDAGHVFPPEDILVFFGADFDGQLALGNAARVTDLELHPDADIAMLAMAEPGPAMPIQLWDQPVAVGQQARVAGFGRNDDAKNGSGVKYSGLTTVVAEDTQAIVTHMAEVGNNFSPSTASGLERAYGKVFFIGNPPGQSQNANHCQGDSGGPTFLSSGGVEYLAGINSFGFGAADQEIGRPNCADQTTTSGSVRVDQYATWMNDFVRKHNGPGTPGAGPGASSGGGGPLDNVFGGCNTGGQGDPGALALALLMLTLWRRRA